MSINFQKQINPFYAFLIIIILAFFTGSFLWTETHYYEPPIANSVKITKKKVKKLLPIEKIKRPIPASVNMNKVKRQGCVADGLLSEYNPDRDDYVDLINRSNCYYLHRAIETWLTPPDFETIEYNINRITKRDVVYGMFIAEAIKENAEYYYPNEDRYFDFEKMCQNGSENVWGMHSCKPDFGSKEYRDYLKYITRQAIDLGVQSFMFGQIYMQAGNGKDKIENVIKEMRTYAKRKGVSIIIGAQTGTITNPEFLSMFDYIEGGVGIDEEGNLPEGPCLGRWGGCWALLWDKTYSQNAKNVLLHLDWTGIKTDDLDIFTRMDKETRARTLKNLYNYFTSRNMGFLMPFFGVLDPENGGCRGPKKKFYSPDNQYGCQDEDAINEILSGKK